MDTVIKKFEFISKVKIIDSIVVVVVVVVAMNPLW